MKFELSPSARAQLLALRSQQRQGPNRCQFTFSDGRNCRMPRAADHHSYCVHHSREDRQLLEAERIGELLAASPSGEYLTATDVNSVLGKLYTAIALNRIPYRNAALLAYVGQLLLQSTSGIKAEILGAQGHEAWRKVAHKALTADLPQPPPTPTALQPIAAASASDNEEKAGAVAVSQEATVGQQIEGPAADLQPAEKIPKATQEPDAASCTAQESTSELDGSETDVR